MTALLLLALALTMDAFAVSMVRGSAGPHERRRAVEYGRAWAAMPRRPEVSC